MIKMIIKDKSLEEDLSYYIYELVKGWHGRNRNVFLDPRPPTPYFEATFRFAYGNFKENKKFSILINNLTRVDPYIDEIIIKDEIAPDSKYEKILISKYTSRVERNPHCLEFTVYFKALKVTPILTPKQQREYDVLILIDNGELHIGVYEDELC